MNTTPCPDCQGGVPFTRREFLKSTATTVAAAAAMPLVFPASAATKPAKKAASETLVTTFHKSLTEQQRKAVCFPFDHELRSKVDNNWHITEQKLGEFFTKISSKW